LAGIGAGLAALAMVAAGCGDDGGGDVLTFGTGSTGGTYFPLGGAMAGVWNDNDDATGVRISTQSSGASVENLQLLGNGEVDLMMAVNGTAETALAGELDADGETVDPGDIQFLGNVYGEVTQIVATASSGIESIEDMAGMTIQLGPAGSGTELSARAILEAAGIDPDSDIEARQDSFGDAISSLRDGQADAAFGILALPHGGTLEAANAVDLNFISVEGDLLQGLLDADSTLSALEVEAGLYPGLDEPITWVTNWATLYTTSDLDEDTAYELVRVLYEQNTEIANAHATGSQIQLATALDGRIDIPIHPGAQRYYDEQSAG
jgi:hypothetical protein